jgi:hypothetical protein
MGIEQVTDRSEGLESLATRFLPSPANDLQAKQVRPESL